MSCQEMTLRQRNDLSAPFALHARSEIHPAIAPACLPGEIADAVEKNTNWQTLTADMHRKYKEAIRIIEETRSGIAEERFQAGYIEDRYQVYVALVELLLKLNKPDDAFFYSEKLRARAYFDLLGGDPPAIGEPAQQRRRELREQIQTLRKAVRKEYSIPENERRGHALELFSSELAEAERDYAALLDNSFSVTGYTSAPGGTLLSATEIQHLLPADTALIEYVVGRQMVSIFLVTPSSVVGMPVQI